MNNPHLSEKEILVLINKIKILLQGGDIDTASNLSRNLNENQLKEICAELNKEQHHSHFSVRDSLFKIQPTYKQGRLF